MILSIKLLNLLYSCNASSERCAGDIPCKILVFMNEAGEMNIVAFAGKNKMKKLERKTTTT
ncbi:MAG: hypothetical protein DWQ10_08590 [Calditrichaeota bacterium]|nr:MAG: hypothetical protein DWQ10_08590 [Calditrichota bacterium]